MRQFKAPNGCSCYACLKASGAKMNDALGGLVADRVFIVCQTCGNKRCPHATNHELACTNSNEPGQAGSNYE